MIIPNIWEHKSHVPVTTNQQGNNAKHGPPDAAPTALDPKITTRGTPGGGAGAAPSGADGSGAAALPLAALAALEVDGPVVQG